MRDPTSFDFEHAHPWIWFSERNLTRKLVWISLLAEAQPDRHWGSGGNHTSGVAHYLYADGHVVAIPAMTVNGWCDAGENFALPQ